MSEPRTSMAGGCHCGNLRVSFESPSSPTELQLRACACSFCRSHGVRTTVDPRGKLDIQVREAAELSRYRFGLKTADYLICRRCGIYVAAVLSSGSSSSGLYAMLNVNVLDLRERFRQPALALDFEGELESERRIHRIATWTPATLTQP